MKKGLWVYLAILLFLAIGADILVLKTEYLAPATTQKFAASSSRTILTSGNTDMVDVTTAGSGYYRIKSGDVFAEGEYITGNYFNDVSQLPVGQWYIEDGGLISFTVVSPAPISVTITSTAGKIIGVIFYTFLVTALLFCFGLVITDN